MTRGAVKALDPGPVLLPARMAMRDLWDDGYLDLVAEE